MPLRLVLFGGFEARLDSGVPVAFARKKAQALLAYLALQPGRAHPRSKLAALLWSELSETAARANVRQALAAIRRAVGHPPLIRTDPDSVRLDPGEIEVDVHRFERLAAEGTLRGRAEAAALYTGPLLEGLGPQSAAFEEWLLGERERLHELAVEISGRLLADYTKLNDLEAALRSGVRLVGLDPLQEAAHRALMRLYARAGRRGDALRQYQICVDVLRRELGADPEDDTNRVYREIVALGAASPAGAPAARWSNAHGSAPPLVGRRPELAALDRALADAEAGRGRVVAILGEAGVGKSRLVAELGDRAAARDARVLFGRGYESEQVLPFGVWVQAFRSGDALAPQGPAADLHPAWRRELTRLFPELTESAAPVEHPLRLFEALAQLAGHIARRQPLVIILEDLHWADVMTLRVLPFVARRLADSPVLLAVTAREEERADAAGLDAALGELEREPHAAFLELRPLSYDDTAVLVAAAGPRVNRADAARYVWAVSEGNPFVVVETVRALEDGSAPELPDRTSLPARARDMIRSRLKRLGRHARALADVAAVVGRDAGYALLRDAAGLEPHEAAEGLEELTRRRVLRLYGDEFVFAHDRIREVVYADLLPPRRALLHAQVARAIETVHAHDLEPRYAALGMHCAEGELWDRAVRYLDRAGIQAAARSAHAEAVAFFDRALDALTHVPDSTGTRELAIDIRLRLRNALMPLGRNERIQQILHEAQRIADTSGDRLRSNRVTCCAMEFMCVSAQYEAAISAGERTIAIAEACGDAATDAEASLFGGIAAFSLGAYERALDAFGRGIRTTERAGRLERFGLAFLPSTACRLWLAWTLAELGRFEAALSIAAEVAAIAGELDHAFTTVEARLAAGVVHVRAGSSDAAIAELEPALALCDENYGRLLPFVAAHLGAAYAQGGRGDDGVRVVTRAWAHAEGSGLIAHQPRWLVMLGEACLAAGAIDDAERHGARALDLARALRERGHEAWSLRLLGEAVARRGDPDLTGAEMHYRAALSRARALGMQPLVAHCQLGLGELHAAAGRPSQALVELTSARELYRSMGADAWLIRAEAAAASV